MLFIVIILILIIVVCLFLIYKLKKENIQIVSNYSSQRITHNKDEEEEEIEVLDI